MSKQDRDFMLSLALSLLALAAGAPTWVASLLGVVVYSALFWIA